MPFFSQFSATTNGGQKEKDASIKDPRGSASKKRLVRSHVGIDRWIISRATVFSKDEGGRWGRALVGMNGENGGGRQKFPGSHQEKKGKESQGGDLELRKGWSELVI